MQKGKEEVKLSLPVAVNLDNSTKSEKKNFTVEEIMEKWTKDTNWYFMEEIEMLSKYIKIFCLVVYFNI